eukprot:5371799-Prymnesium_polylepis.1
MVRPWWSARVDSPPENADGVGEALPCEGPTLRCELVLAHQPFAHLMPSRGKPHGVSPHAPRRGGVGADGV